MRRNMSGMSRRRFLGTAAAGVGAAALGASGVVRAGGQGKNPYTVRLSGDTVKVYPMGNYPPTSNANALDSKGIPFSDVNNVRHAIASVPPGGTVILSSKEADGITPGEFNFGNESVKLTRKGPITIVGEGDRDTTIIGGYPAFEAPLINAGGNPDAVFTIENINFVNTKFSAVAVYTCAEANIVDNAITLGSGGRFQTYSALPGVFRFAIMINSADLDPANIGYIGDVTIKDNDINCFPEVNDTTDVGEWHYYSGGIMTLGVRNQPIDLANDTPSQTLGGTVKIEDNVIDNPGHAGIHIGGTSAVDVEVRGNEINQLPTSYYKFYKYWPPHPVTGLPWGDEKYRLRAGEGIRVLSAPAFGGHCLRVELDNNPINSVVTTGIAVRDVIATSDDCILKNNTITMAIDPDDQPEGSRGIYIGSTPTDLVTPDRGPVNIYAENNTIKGEAYYGYYVKGGSGGEAHDNLICLYDGNLDFTLWSDPPDPPPGNYIYFVHIPPDQLTYDNYVYLNGYPSSDVTDEKTPTDNHILSGPCP